MPFLGSWFKDEGDFGIPPTSKRKIDMDSLVWAGACEGNILDDFCRLPIITMIITIVQGTYHGDLKRLCYDCVIFVDMCIHHYTTYFFEVLGPNKPPASQPRTKEWETVVIDEFVPCNVSCGQPRPAFARPLGEEIWVLLLLGVSQLYPRPTSIFKKNYCMCTQGEV